MGVKTSVLFGLTLFDEMLSQFRDPGGFISFSYKNLYGFVPKSYRRNNLYSLVHKLRTEGNLKDFKRGNFHLTQKGKSITMEYFPILRYVHRPWDGRWRVLGFDIEEERRSIRNTFRKFLYRFGFGMLQESLYISALPIEKDIEEFISSHRELLLNTYIFVSDKFFLEESERFIERIFHISKINDLYRDILEKTNKNSGVEENDNIIRGFLEVSSKDPFLPKELLPKGFLRNVVWKVLKEKGILLTE